MTSLKRYRTFLTADLCIDIVQVSIKIIHHMVDYNIY